ncbi:MAG TPA: HTTM domain-containing protein [Microscillaceae bacterium]|nr:HTTM domain-containing protein [Microscillaceae bacterium]
MAYLFRPVSIAPLISFRIIFGALMLYSTIRFIAKGWVYTHLVAPKLHFTYFGFAWIKPLPEVWMYGVFGLMVLACVGIILGCFYRVATITFFLTFTYTELIDITYYLNHYYFVSLVAFLLIFVPANRAFSVDVRRKPHLQQNEVPAWTIGIFKLQIAIVYFYAGLAKMNSEWLLDAMPLTIWLPAKTSLPVIGFIFKYKITAYLFSWAGMLFDTFIVGFLLWRKTRILAYVAVVVFHTLTALLFQIGVFPLVMSCCVLIFFSAEFHERLIPLGNACLGGHYAPLKSWRKVTTAFLVVFFAFQVLFPWRYLLYKGNLFWTEEGYRFSWRVMLMEKAGTATFFIKDTKTGREGAVPNRQFLNDVQEKQMAMQPDLILQYAHFLKKHYAKKGVTNPEVRAKVQVTLNARPSQLLIDPQVDLGKIQDGWKQKYWILKMKKAQ